MTRAEAWLQHVANLWVGATGLIFGWMLYCIPEDPESFSLVNHPWQPELQGLHILGAPLLVFGLGMLWRTHIWRRYRSGFQAHRKTGLGLMILMLPMVLSGYLLQLVSDESWRLIWVWVHGSSSCLWIGLYALHQFAARTESKN